jgi:hypothetical protein
MSKDTNFRFDAKRKPAMLFKALSFSAMLLLFGVVLAVTQTQRSKGVDELAASLKMELGSESPGNIRIQGQENILPREDAQEEFNKDLARIENFLRVKDLDGLVITADELEEKWSQRGGELYGRLMLSISNGIANGFDDERIYKLSQKYAAAALTKADTFSLDLETKLLGFIAMDIAPVPAVLTGDSDWARERSTKAKLWLHAWQRLEREIDRNFDFNDVPSLNVCPPAETGLPCGIAPEGIRDPELRAKYSAAIAANTAKAKKFNQQYKLRAIGERFTAHAEQYLVRVYSKPPYNLEELKVYLNERLANRDLRERIVNEVKKKIAE